MSDDDAEPRRTPPLLLVNGLGFSERVTDLWAWVAMTPDQREGIVTGTIPELATVQFITTGEAHARGTLRDRIAAAQRSPGYLAAQFELRRYHLAEVVERL